MVYAALVAPGGDAVSTLPITLPFILGLFERIRMTVPRGRADKAIVDGINELAEAVEALDIPEVLDDAGIAALVADENSALYAALVALIAAETA